MEKWKTAIREAQTLSRMHVLLGMLDACIKWDMSAENARCKVCRKKGEADRPSGGAAPTHTRFTAESLLRFERSCAANRLPASCSALRPSTEAVLMLSESKPDSQQGAPVLRAGQASRVRQVYVQGWKLRRSTGEMVAQVAKVFTFCPRVTHNSRIHKVLLDASTKLNDRICIFHLKTKVTSKFFQ